MRMPKDIPILLLARHGSHISTTLRGIARQIILYHSPEELTEQMINPRAITCAFTHKIYWNMGQIVLY